MAATSKREIAIIDQAVDDLETLPSGVRPDVGPILLSKNEPAARQMARAVRGRKGLEAVHIMAHGQPGGLAFSSALLSLDTPERNAGDLAVLGSAIGQGGELRAVAQGEHGTAFVDAIADATGARVAASARPVGAAARRKTMGGPLAEGFSEMKAINPATLAKTRVHAAYCEGDNCCDPEGEVRAYPILFFSRAARVILCRSCWEHENRHRHERGEELGCPEHWPTRDWDAAERYQPLRSASRDDIVASRTDALANPTTLAEARVDAGRTSVASCGTSIGCPRPHEATDGCLGLSYHVDDASCSDRASEAARRSAGLRFDRLARRPIREARFG